MRRSNIKYLLFVCLMVIIAAPTARGTEATFIDKDQLKDELGRPGVIIIDVRAPHDWDSSQLKIQGAVRESPAEAEEWMGKYPKDKTIVLYCA